MHPVQTGLAGGGLSRPPAGGDLRGVSGVQGLEPPLAWQGAAGPPRRDYKPVTNDAWKPVGRKY